jgi:hypothetical protein
MRRAQLSVLGFAVTAALMTPGGCKKPDTILLIEIAGPISIKPSQFLVNVNAGFVTRLLEVPLEPRSKDDPIILPTSFSLGLDRSHTGPITVTIDARGDDKSTVGFGTTIQQHIVIGGQTVITVFLMEGMDPGPDGGAGAGGGGGSTTGGGGQGGASGGAGAGGQAGQDGAAGAGGPGDAADDGMGLDGAAD